MEEISISIGDLLAAVCRKGKQIIGISILFAILLGGVQGYLTWSMLNDEEYRDLERAVYEQELLKLEQTIERTEIAISDKQDYINNSIFMKVDPYDKYSAEIYLSISGVDETQVNMTFGQNVTPTDYLMGQIIAQYQIAWSTINFPVQLNLPEYEAFEDKYVRELLKLNFPSANILCIYAIGRSNEEAVKLAEAACAALLKEHETVVANSFAHNIAVFDRIEKNVIDDDMALYQMAQYDALIDFDDAIIAAEEELVKLTKPDDIFTTIVKMMIIGGLVGGVLACAWYCGKSLAEGKVQSSSHAERMLSVSFLGNMADNKNIFDKLADICCSERIWKDQEQALQYIAEIVKIRAQNKRVLLLSSLKLEKYTPIVEKLKSTLGTDAAEGDFIHNPNALVKLNEADAVVMLEKIDRTKISDAAKICTFAEECDKSIIGFIML